MKKIFICCTPYQLIVAYQLKLTVYKNNVVDIILCETFNNSKSIYLKIKKCNDFNTVYFMKKEIFDKNLLIYKNDKIMEVLVKGKLKKMGLSFDASLYDEVFFANIGGVSFLLAKYLKLKNENIKCNMFEDGISSYSNLFYDVVKKMNNITGFIKKIHYKLNLNMFSIINGFYVFKPDCMIWDCPYKVIKIPDLSLNKREIVDKLNFIFEYKTMVDKYDKKNIFFEESYFADGIDINDIDLVDKICKVCGKNQMMIKIHPRNNKNRFVELGYKTNKNVSIPWELIVLNEDFNEKTLITISSNALITTCLLLDSKCKLIFLYKLVGQSNERLTNLIEVIQKMINIYPDYIIVPSAIEDVHL